ncbi:Sulfatase [Salipiger thiooxidans]|uniref:Sulfatase n=2 Tax=Salipiger thiooxidans TaxID=282683 RepID=A0A1G7G7F2_9RHOB|nr:Sulfatase [Salipiger thiooxidans]
MDTPNIDRLVAHGVSFEHCHVTAPFCVPSRASLFLGYPPHTNGVLANGTEWSRTWVSDLAHAGYHCVNIGKMYTIPYDAKAGFLERFVVDARWFTDEWDKAILNAGHAKPGRLSDRKRGLPAHARRLRVDARGQAAFRQLHWRLHRVAARQQAQGRAAVSVHRLPRPAPALRSDAGIPRDIHGA